MHRSDGGAVHGSNAIVASTSWQTSIFRIDALSARRSRHMHENIMVLQPQTSLHARDRVTHLTEIEVRLGRGSSSPNPAGILLDSGRWWWCSPLTPDRGTFFWKAMECYQTIRPELSSEYTPESFTYHLKKRSAVFRRAFAIS
jgi:hypothetical protein